LGGGQQTAAATPGWASGWLGQAPALGKDPVLLFYQTPQLSPPPVV